MKENKNPTDSFFSLKKKFKIFIETLTRNKFPYEKDFDSYFIKHAKIIVSKRK